MDEVQIATDGDSPMLQKLEKGVVRYWVGRMDVAQGWIEVEYGVMDTPNPTKRKRAVVPKAKRTMEEQCLQELRQRYKEKIQEGYRVGRVQAEAESSCRKDNLTVPSSVESFDEEVPGVVLAREESSSSPSFISPNQMRLPMLAANFSDRLSKKNGVTYPLHAQAKANGVRGLFVLTPSGVNIYSRTLHSYYFMTSLREDVLSMLSLRPDVVLDGELFAKGIAGQHITSIAVQKSKPHPEEDKVQLWLFDCYVPSQPLLTFTERRKLLEELMAESKPERVILMDSVLVSNPDELEAVHLRHQREGWEGTMLRADKPYEHRRSHSLMKYKFASEMDSKIVDIERTEGGDARLHLLTDTGKSFTHRPEGTVEEKETWLNKPSLVIGRVYSCSYTHLSEDGIPLAIHNGCIRFDLP